jgi:hypothetical protein
MRNPLRLTLLRLSGLACAGCSRAPAVNIIGSFFPVWMLCLLVAVIVTFAVRSLLVRLRLNAEVGPVAVFYPSVLVLSACLVWLIFFR